MVKEKPMKKLYDCDILEWDLKESSWYVTLGAYTVLKENLGIENVNDSAGPFVLYASAATHLVGIHRRDDRYIMKKPEDMPLEEELMFNGAVEIYKDDALVRHGRIWIAMPSKDVTLKTLIFGNAYTPKDKQKVIKEILNAYDKRDKDLRTAQFERDQDLREGAKQHALWRKRHGYFD
jgi:hypothetical protein